MSKNLATLEKYYPKNKFVITKRNSKSISDSILKKGGSKKMIVFRGFIIIQNYLEKILTENGLN